MQRYMLENGINVIEKKTNSESVSIIVMVRSGSIHEEIGEKGINHFIEHLLFEGTTNRPSPYLLNKEIDSIGGSFNGETDKLNNAYSIITINKHLEKAIDILSDMIKNSLFNSESIEKERQVIINEIDSAQDNPREIAVDLFFEALFGKNSLSYPIAGLKEDVLRITQNQIKEYHRNHFVGSNIHIVIVGNIDNCKNRLIKYFGDLPKGKPSRLSNPLDFPVQLRKLNKKMPFSSSYFTLGFRSVARDNPDSYTFDVISAILSGGQSGRLFNEVRNIRGLAYDIDVLQSHFLGIGCFVVVGTCSKENLEKIKSLSLNELMNLDKRTEIEINDAKSYLEGITKLRLETTLCKAEFIAEMELIGDAKLSEDYLDNISKVTKEDIIRVSKKYFSQDYAYVTLEGK